MPENQERTRTGTRQIALLGTAPETMGGISAVINSYARAGLFERWPLLHLPTHCDGSATRKALIAARSYARFLLELARRRVTLVHVHSASNASFWRKSLFINAAFAAKVPVVFHLHGGGFVDFYRRRRGALRRRAIRHVLDRSAAVVVLSDEWRARIGKITSNPNIKVIANPVELNRYAVADAASRSKSILFAGRLVRDKGVLDLVAAYARLRKRHPDWRLQFAGEGDSRAIRARATALGVGSGIDFLGWVQGERKDRMFAQAGVYALPSYMEGLPRSVLEAMAAGLPVVATHVGGIPGIISGGRNGLLVEPGDIDALADALLELVEAPRLRTQMGTESMRRIEQRFTPDKVLPRIESLYRRLGATPLSAEGRRQS